MTKTNQDVVLFAGDHLEIHVLVWEVTRGARIPVNPAGITARYKANDFIDRTSADGGISIGTKDGTMALTVVLREEDTKHKAFRRPYAHEIEIRDEHGKPSTVLTGTLEIRPALIP